MNKLAKTLTADVSAAALSLGGYSVARYNAELRAPLRVAAVAAGSVPAGALVCWENGFYSVAR